MILSQKNSSDKYYILLDKVPSMDEFVDILKGFLHIPNAVVYDTESNSKFLSKDVAAVFRGRAKD